MACDGGRQTHYRKVVVPIRGLGKCPKEKSWRRWGTKKCNTQKCVGDEICIAAQDLIIAIDASGSLRESGFKVLRDFAANLTDRYQPEFFGKQSMKVGVLMFGQGHIEADGTITPATNVLPLTSDMKVVRDKILALTWQRGFTNMAQALSLADVMLQQGRKEAQSAVMVLSDGKPSFWYQTIQKARELMDKNIQIFMAPVTDFKSKELRWMRTKLASQPWRTNYVRVPGLETLEHNMDIFKQKVIATFCPDAMSLEMMRQKEDARQYMLIREDGYPDFQCGKGWFFKGHMGRDDCANAARTAGQASFFIGKGEYRDRYCYTADMSIDETTWNKWLPDRVKPNCPNGKWLVSKYFDTYAIHPSTIVSATTTAATR